MKKILILFIDLCAFIYSRFIILNLFLLGLTNKKFYYNHSLGFGDSICYYLHYYNEIRSSRQNIPLAFGSFHEKIVSFFFSKYKKIFFKIFAFMPYYRIIKYLTGSTSYFKPIFNYKIGINGLMEDDLLLSKNYDKIFKNILAKKKISNKVKKLTKKKYICFFIKNYNNNINDLSSNPVCRQTTNFEKIKKILLYLISKNFNVLILGNSKDKGTLAIKKKHKNMEKLYFLENYKINFDEQIYISNKSSGFIGNQAGLIIPFILLKKKTLVFDGCATPYIKKHTNLKHVHYIFKKIVINKKKFQLHSKFENYKKKYSIIENNYREIKKKINKIFL